MRDNDNWGVGELADGSISIVDQKKAADRKRLRNAYEAAFNKALTPEGEIDLQSLSIEELDAIINME